MKGVYQRPKVLIQNLRFKHAYLCVMNEAYSFLSSILKQAPPQTAAIFRHRLPAQWYLGPFPIQSSEVVSHFMLDTNTVDS